VSVPRFCIPLFLILITLCRPDATTVMIHPFFWSPEKRLNFLVDVSDQFEFEPRDPPSSNLQTLESDAQEILGADFLKRLDKSFVDTLGKQRKYTGTRILDLLRALRNKVSLFGSVIILMTNHIIEKPL